MTLIEKERNDDDYYYYKGDEWEISFLKGQIYEKANNLNKALELYKQSEKEFRENRLKSLKSFVASNNGNISTDYNSLSLLLEFSPRSLYNKMGEILYKLNQSPLTAFDTALSYQYQLITTTKNEPRYCSLDVIENVENQIGNTRIILYTRGKDKLITWSIKKGEEIIRYEVNYLDHPGVFNTDGSIKPFFRGNPDSSPDVKKFKKISKQYYSAFIEPLKLFQKDEAICIMGESDIFTIPFHILMDDNDKVLIQDHPVFFQYSFLQWYDQLKRKKNYSGNYVLIYPERNNDLSEMHKRMKEEIKENIISNASFTEIIDIIKDKNPKSLALFTHARYEKNRPLNSEIYISNQDVKINEFLEITGNIGLFIAGGCEILRPDPRESTNNKNNEIEKFYNRYYQPIALSEILLLQNAQSGISSLVRSSMNSSSELIIKMTGKINNNKPVHKAYQESILELINNPAKTRIEYYDYNTMKKNGYFSEPLNPLFDASQYILIGNPFFD